MWASLKTYYFKSYLLLPCDCLHLRRFVWSFCKQESTLWDHLNEEKVKKRSEGITVTHNEEPMEAGNSPWQPGHSCQVFKKSSKKIIEHLYSGSQSQMYNHSLKGPIVKDGCSLSISVSHPVLQFAENALRSFVDTFRAPCGGLLLCSQTEKCCGQHTGPQKANECTETIVINIPSWRVA